MVCWFPLLGDRLYNRVFHGGRDGARFPNIVEELEEELFVLFV